MGKIAHIENAREQTVREHLENVAEMTSEFCEDYAVNGTDAAQYGYEAGLAHDIGKYSERFQEKIRGNYDIAVDHSTAGARELHRLHMPAAAFAVAGHHGGIPNGWDLSKQNLVERITKRELESYDDFKKEICLRAIAEPSVSPYEEAFFTKMVFSALVDADFIDTECFMSKGSVDRGGYEPMDVLFTKLLDYIRPWRSVTDDTSKLNKIRTEILERCLQEGQGERGLFRLTIPTGGGKTISSLSFALQHAERNKMKRVIYVVPYTSIIEQTVDIFREILGEENVLAHYSGALLDSEKEEKEYYARHKLSIENWDAPIVVTTNVQFFESLYSNKVSKCRKLHNIANSVVVFDEAQMIPLPFLIPCLKAIETLICSYRISAVLCTATQPALEKYMETLTAREIYGNYSSIYQYMKRTQIRDAGTMSETELSERLVSERQVLAIVNTKKSARNLFQGLSGEGNYHLSTYMTPYDRKRTLALVRERLKKGEVCRVVSTSLVEAGVDLDFPIVFREVAGLDSVIQAAGRCNREGNRPCGESIVWVFRMAQIPQIIAQNVAMTEETLEKYGEYDSLEAIQNYFSSLQMLNEDVLDRHHIVACFEKGMGGVEMPFKEVAELFHLIEDNTKMLIVPNVPEALQLWKELEERLQNQENFRKVLQKLGAFAINLYEREYLELISDGNAYELTDGIAVLNNLELYKSDIGLFYEKCNGATIV